MKSKKLVLFTTRYPFFQSETFLETEITYLSDHFDKVIIIPRYCDDQPRPVPGNVEVVEEYAKNHVNNRFLNAVRGGWKLFLDWAKPGGIMDRDMANTTEHRGSRGSRGSRGNTEIQMEQLLVREWRNNRKHILHPVGLIRMCIAADTFFYCYKWMKTRFRETYGELSDYVFYSYWVNYETLALTEMKFRSAEFPVASRTHAADIYQERHVPPYLPFRKIVLHDLDAVYPISDYAVAYLSKEYGKPADNMEVQRLGTLDPDHLNLGTEGADDRHIVSCSNIIPLKRVEWIVEVLGKLVDQVDFRLSWTHFGTGDDIASLKELASVRLGDKVSWTFKGLVSNREIINFYRAVPVDLFVSTSSTEGIPVTVMEAFSFGIPAVMFDVGAVAEIIDDSCGALVPPDGGTDAFTAAVKPILSDPEIRQKKSRNARKVWLDNYDAEKNYPVFAEKLSALSFK